MKPRVQSQSRPMDHINITPFVDICLVILLIFMIVTPLLVPGHPVTLPEASNLSPQAEDKEAVTLSVDAAGVLYMGEEQVDLAQLSHVLGDAHAENPERPVRMMGDGRAPFGSVKGVLKAAEAVGFRKIALMATDRSPEPAKLKATEPLDTERKGVYRER
jgi:biopolymer transport protein ExbD